MKFTLLVTFLSIIFYFGCSQDPSSVGKNLLLDSDKLMTDTLTITSEKSSSYPITTSNNSPTLMVGRSNGVVAEMLLQFGPFVVDTAIANSIISVKIKMLPNYSFKDTTGTMAVSMHRMPIPWNESTFNADSLTTYDINPIDVPHFTINYKDSLIEFPVDNNIVSDWLKGVKNNGIILVPKLSSNIIFGFKSYYNSVDDDARPQVIITYQLPTDTVKTMTLRTVQDATIFSGVRPSSMDSLFYVQGGLIERGKISFDVSSIHKSVAITQAFLELKIDTLSSIFSSFTDRGIRVHDIVTADSIPKLGALSSAAKPDGNKYMIDVRSLVQQWVTGRPNYGIALRSDNEFEQVERFAVYGFSAQADSKPKLIIKYTFLP